MELQFLWCGCFVPVCVCVSMHVSLQAHTCFHYRSLFISVCLPIITYVPWFSFTYSIQSISTARHFVAIILVRCQSMTISISFFSFYFATLHITIFMSIFRDFPTLAAIPLRLLFELTAHAIIEPRRMKSARALHACVQLVCWCLTKSLVLKRWNKMRFICELWTLNELIQLIILYACLICSVSFSISVQVHVQVG